MSAFLALLLGMAGPKVPACAQSKVKFAHYSLDEGLSQSYAFSILQDSRGFIWIGTEDGLNRFDGQNFKTYRNDPDDMASLSYNNIRALCEDPQGNLWAGTLKGQINRYDRNTETFAHYQLDPDDTLPSKGKIILTAVADAQGGIWAGTIRAGLYCKKPDSDRFLHFLLPQTTESNQLLTSVYALALDQHGAIWAGTNQGLYRIELPDGRVTQFTQQPKVPNSLRDNKVQSLSLGQSGKLWIGTAKGIQSMDTRHLKLSSFGDGWTTDCRLDGYNVQAIKEDLDGNLWAATQAGLFRWAPGSDCYQRFVHHPANAQGLSNDYIYTIALDLEGGVWIGTRDGANRYDAKLHRFRHYAHEPGNPRSLPNNSVWTFKPDETGVVWVKSRTAQSPFDLERGVLSVEELPASTVEHILKPMRQFVLEDRDGNIWARDDNSLYIINRSTGQVQAYPHTDINSKAAYYDHGRAYETRNGTVWLKTSGGMLAYYPSEGRFEAFYHDPQDPASLSSSAITDFFEDSRGRLWLGTRGGGVMLMDGATKNFRHFLHDPSDPNSLSDDVVHVIHEDYLDRIWVSSPSGLNVLEDEEQGHFRRIRRKDGLPNDYVYGILEDQHRQLWMATNMGIVRYHLETGAFRSYGPQDGVQANEFNDDSYWLDPKSGNMYFGGVNGFTVFHPDSIRDDTYTPPIAITSFQHITRNEKGAVLTGKPGITEQTTVRVPHRHKALLLFEFASLSFSKPQHNQYAYQLEGYNDDWIPLGNRRSITFTNLAPGNYKLRVKGANGDGHWNETPAFLKIVILPPWYWAWYSKTLYLLLAAGLLYTFYRFQLSRQLAHAEAQRLKELDELKSRLNANITHEFRTPLTLILGMADQIEQSPRQWLHEGLTSIRANSKRILRLVNQLLDLARLEAGRMPVQLQQADILAHLRIITELFRSNADAKGLSLTFQSMEGEIVMDYDPDKMTGILYNLLSNALKFTPSGGAVSLRAQRSADEHFQLEVADTGPGIAAKQLPYIFDRFYQGDDSATRRGEGTGIGLSLAWALAKRLGGTLTAQSELGKGTVFTLRLPITNMAPPTAHPPALSPELLAPVGQPNAPTGRTPGELPMALIVEDNPEVARYLTACLRGQYRIVTATDGKHGLARALELAPEIIISDVMMPEKDGFELCHELKNDPRTSHIPVILLTAMADMDSRVKGLQMGADAYLVKPFDQRELEASLRQSLLLRQRLRQRYAGGRVPDEPETEFSRDDAFVVSLQAFLQAHYGNEALRIQDMAIALHFSQRQLNRKVSQLFGTTPQLYLRTFRLKKARHLLRTTDRTVTEIAHSTGFSNLSYFSRAFSEEFGMPPGKVRE